MLRCYQFISGAAGILQPICTGAECAECAKWCQKRMMCSDLVTALELRSLSYVANNKGKVSAE
jgi:hypothetical protein